MARPAHYKADKPTRAIWDDLQAGKFTRKGVIECVIEKAWLKQAGSSTYYRAIKKKLSQKLLRNSLNRLQHRFHQRTAKSALLFLRPGLDRSP